MKRNQGQCGKVTYPDSTRFFLSILTESAGGCCFCLLERQTQVDTLC